MFHKPFRVKSNILVKGSIRKGIRRDLSSQYPLLTEESLDKLIPSKGGLNCIKFEGAKTTSMYYAVDDDPVLFVNEGRLYPTVYSLWRAPDMIRCVATNEFVFKKLMDGADLMLPGVYTEQHGGFSLEGISAGQPLAVTLLGTRSVVAVGVSLMSHDQMVANGMKGKLVEVFHVYKDHLWAAGRKQELPMIPLPLPPAVTADEITISHSNPVNTQDDPEDHLVQGSIERDGSDQAVCEVLDRDEKYENRGLLEDVMDEVQVSVDTEQDEPSAHMDFEKPEEVVRSKMDVIALSHSSDEEIEPEELEVDMDALLLECCLKALKSLVKSKDLPLLTSNFYGNIMMSVCPSHLKLDIKRSSFKKVSKFLSSLVEKGLLEIRSDGGSDRITAIKFDHVMIAKFRPDLIQRQPDTASQVEPLIGKSMISVEELWSPTQPLAPIFSPHGIHKRLTLSASDVRSIITQYIKSNGLVKDDNPGMVSVDPVLSSALKLKQHVIELSWKQLFTSVFEQMRPSFLIRHGKSDPIIRHSLPKVKLTLCRRANKTVTLVDNLEVFGIPLSELSQRVMRTGACHSAVQPSLGGGGNNQVLIQGNQVKLAVKILEDLYGLPTKFMEAQDKIKPAKPKKGKR